MSIIIKNKTRWLVKIAAFLGMDYMWGSRCGGMNTFPGEDGHYKSGCHQQHCGGWVSEFQHIGCPASAHCLVKVVLNLLSPLASDLRRHFNVHVVGQILHGVVAK